MRVYFYKDKIRKLNKNMFLKCTVQSCSVSHCGEVTVARVTLTSLREAAAQRGHSWAEGTDRVLVRSAPTRGLSRTSGVLHQQPSLSLPHACAPGSLRNGPSPSFSSWTKTCIL